MKIQALLGGWRVGGGGAPASVSAVGPEQRGLHVAAPLANRPDPLPCFLGLVMSWQDLLRLG